MKKIIVIVIVAIIAVLGFTYWLDASVVDAVGVVEVVDDDFHNPECLVETFRENPYSRLWCRETEQAAQMGRFGVEISTLTGGKWGEWKPTRIFPALGKRVPVGYFDRGESGLTVAITDDGVGLYRPNGEVVGFGKAPNDPRKDGMLVFPDYGIEANESVCWAVVGESTFVIDFQAGTLERTDLDPWTSMFRSGSDSRFVTIDGGGYVESRSW